MKKWNRRWLICLTISSLAACEGHLGDLAGGPGPDLGPGPGPTGAGGVSVGGGGDPGSGGGGAGAPGAGSGNGSGGAPGNAGSGGTTAGPCRSGAVPADVQALLAARCTACHNRPPLPTVPVSLTSYADLTARSPSDPTRTNAQVALARMQDSAKPMPPDPLMRATAAEIATMQRWLADGAPAASCPDAGTADAGGISTDGGAGQDSDPMIDPFTAAPICTSKKTWTGGNRGNQQMNPGLACITCHTRGEGPRFAIAGTLYPTAHEPDLCNGVSGAGTGAQVVIVGASGQQVTLTPNAAGNFTFSGNITKPYKAKVVYMGRERAMIEAQVSGDCNSCHTQNGAMPSGAAMKAPGRILLP